jgi:hypothetical protein
MELPLFYILLTALRMFGRLLIGVLDPRRWRVLLAVVSAVVLIVALAIVVCLLNEDPKDPCSDAAASIISAEVVCGAPSPYVETVFTLDGLRQGCRPWVLVQRRASASFLPPSSPTAMNASRWLAFVVVAVYDDQYLAYIVVVRDGTGWGPSLPEGAVILDRKRVDGDCAIPATN